MKNLITLIFVFVWAGLTAQDIDYARKVINDLCSPDMHGRGYVLAGDKKAAFYVENEFKAHGLFAYDTLVVKSGDEIHRLKKYTQDFTISVNTFPENTLVALDKNTPLVPGVDYLVKPVSGSIEKKELELVYLSKKDLKNEDNFNDFLDRDFTSQALVIDLAAFEKEMKGEFMEQILDNYIRADALIFLTKGKLTWAVRTMTDKFPSITIKKEKLPKDAKSLIIDIPSKFIRNYPTQNVIGKVEGSKYPDKYIVVGAHYDHLGAMGENVFFPGANDNASGVAMMLDLASYYSEPAHQPEYSFLFIAFGAEEAGLLGSIYFVNNPKVPLKNIEFMLNLDMEATGERGITVVNGSEFKNQFAKLKKINEQKQYLPQIVSRGEAANSDHYPFYIEKIPCFFIYQMGIEDKEYYYHNPGDKPDNISLAGYEATFRLLLDFFDELQK